MMSWEAMQERSDWFRWGVGVRGSGFEGWGSGVWVCSEFGVKDFISKLLQFINLVQGNLLRRTIFISNIKVNV